MMETILTIVLLAALVSVLSLSVSLYVLIQFIKPQKEKKPFDKKRIGFD